MPTMQEVKKDDRILTAFAESCSGPGWANSLIHVIAQTKGSCELKHIYLQPKEFPKGMWNLFGISEAVNNQMVGMIEGMRETKGKP